MKPSDQFRPLGSLVKFLSGGTPRKSVAEYWSGEIPWVSSGEMMNEQLFDTGLHISESGAQNGSRVVPARTTLCVVRGMSLAKEFRVSITHRPMAFNQDLKALSPKEEVDPIFLFYSLLARRDFVRDSATEASHGTKKLETRFLEDLPVWCPPLPTQTRIADILSAYDDLIENNKRRMQLLEEAARQLYREWFVRLRFPGHEHTPITNGLPEGWERKPIAEFATIVGGGTPKTTIPEYWDDGEVIWVTPTDVTRNSHFCLLDSEKKITEAGLKNSSAKLVPPHSILMTSRASVGFFALIRSEVCTNQGFISIVPNEKLATHFLLLQLSERVEEIRSMGTGSTYPEVSRGKFKEFEVVMPSAKTISIFSDYASPMFDQLWTLKQQNQKLRTARDLLLPKLMNGEIAV